MTLPFSNGHDSMSFSPLELILGSNQRERTEARHRLIWLAKSQSDHIDLAKRTKELPWKIFHQSSGSEKLTFSKLGIAAVANLIRLHVNTVRNVSLVPMCNTHFTLFVLIKETKVFVTSGVQFSLLFSKTIC